MVWGALSRIGQTKMVFTSCRMNSTDYIQNFESNILPFMANSYEYIFQLNDSSIHRSNAMDNANYVVFIKHRIREEHDFAVYYEFTLVIVAQNCIATLFFWEMNAVLRYRESEVNKTTGIR